MARRVLLLLLLPAFVFGAEVNQIAVDRFLPNTVSLYVANADGTNERLLLQQPSNLDYNGAYSADGKSIVFTSERDGSSELYKVKLREPAVSTSNRYGSRSRTSSCTCRRSDRHSIEQEISICYLAARSWWTKWDVAAHARGAPVHASSAPLTIAHCLCSRGARVNVIVCWVCSRRSIRS